MRMPLPVAALVSKCVVAWAISLMRSYRSSLCTLCVLCVSVVSFGRESLTTETQRTRRVHKENEDLYQVSTPGLWSLTEHLNRGPCFVRVEEFDLVGKLDSRRTQILFIDDPIVTNHEGLHARKPVLGRKGNERKAANHRALNDEVHLPKRSIRSLPFEHFEEVAAIWF